MKTQDQTALRMYLRAREDFQAMRKRMDNRLGRKKDGTIQNLHESRSFAVEDVANFDYLAKESARYEKETAKMLKQILKKFPIYNEWLSTIKGIGEIHAAAILSEFDIEIATTVSKMTQYAGLNPGMVQGKKRIAKSDYKKKIGEIVSEIKNGNKVEYIVKTDTLVRGDRPMEGFVLPYNKNLKTRLMGIVADSFIKAQNSYAIEFYYPYKARLEREENLIQNEGKPRRDDGKPWKEVSKGHRDFAAKRYMIKMFLIDLYVAWRTIEGLPVREPYAVEYLGKVHK